MYKKKRCSLRLALCLFSTGAITAYGAQQFEIIRSTVDGGGVMRSAGGAYVLSGSVGQPDAGTMTGPGIELHGGFWFPVALSDSNEDGLVNLEDYEALLACLAGPGETLEPGCEPFDLNGDGNVDMGDVRLFLLEFTGR